MFIDSLDHRASADFLSVADYALQLTAVAYGVFATAVDFKIEKNGEKRLSRTGILGLTFLAITSLAAIQIKVLKDRKDDKAREAQKAIQDQANANIARNVEMSKSLLAGLSRMQDPVEGNFTLLMILKLVKHPSDQSQGVPAHNAKGRKGPLDELSVKIQITDKEDAFASLSASRVSLFGVSLFPLSSGNFTSNCSTSLLSIKERDATLSCLGPSSAWTVGRPQTYADIDGAPINLQIHFDDQDLDIETPIVTLTGTRKQFRLEDLTRLKTCDSHMACFRGILRVSPL